MTARDRRGPAPCGRYGELRERCVDTGNPRSTMPVAAVVSARTRRRLGLAGAFSIVGAFIVAGLVATFGGAIDLKPPPGGSSMSGMSGMAAMARESGKMGMEGASMSASSCDLVSPGSIDGAIHRLVATPVAKVSRLSTTCSYKLSSSPGAVVITYTMGVTRSAFQAAVTEMARTLGGAPHVVVGGGHAVAIEATGASQGWSAVLVLKGSNELVMKAPGTPGQLTELAGPVVATM